MRLGSAFVTSTFLFLEGVMYHSIANAYPIQPFVTFSQPPSQRHSYPAQTSQIKYSTLLFAQPKSDDAVQSKGVRKKKKTQQKKKRRFAQDVNPLVAFDPVKAQKKVEASRPTKNANSSNSIKEREYSDVMQSGKSIEELENVMSKRWGTKLDKWTADPSQFEFVFDDDGGSNDSPDPPKKKVRSRQVLDPWQKEERHELYLQRQKEKKEKEKNQIPTTNAVAFNSAQNRNDAALEKVRNNQERLRLQRRGGQVEEEELSEVSDQDAKSNEANSFFFFDNQTRKSDQGGTTSKEDSSNLKKEKVAKEKKVLRQVKLDGNGQEMCLTLGKAEAEIEDIMKESEIINDENNSSMSWKEVGITNNDLLENLSNMNCPSPLAVQLGSCPPIVSGNDVLLSTHTGSGKTIAFLAPLAERLMFDADEKSKGSAGVKVIIVAPGRELASQIVAVARNLFEGTGLTAMLAIGGTPFSRNFEQIRKKKPDFLVGTPGRIAELVVGKPGDKSGKLKLGSLRAVVLDECDALLEYEPHREPTSAIMDVLQRRYRVGLHRILCSATAGDLFGKTIIDDFLQPGYAHVQSDQNDKLITSMDDTQKGASQTRVSRTVIHGVVHVQHRRFTLDTLKKVLYTEPAPEQALIFVSDARRVGIVVEKLGQMGIIAAPLHGGSGSEKGDRAEVNKALREGFVGLVVATEMAARGIDAPYLTHVINLDLPTDASHYAHRAGRCGRGGRPGVVVNFAVGNREKKVPAKFAEALGIEMHEVETRNGKLQILENEKAKND